MKTDRPGKKQIHFRITEEEYEKLIPIFREHGGVGKYFMFVSSLNLNKGTALKIDTRKELNQFYKKYCADLSHLGSNLNQHIRHYNELNKIGVLNKKDIEETIPLLQELNNLLLSIQNGLFDLAKRITKS